MSATRSVLCALLVACAPDLHLEDVTLVRCDDGVCPTDWTCVSGVCEPPGNARELPRVALAFTLPQEAEQNVPLLPTFVLAFSMRVVATSLDEHVWLENGDEIIVLSRVAEDDAGSTYRFASPRVLTGDTLYRLHVDAGIAPDSGGAVASEDEAVITFTTRHGDLVPPGPVTNLVVERRSATHIHLSWTPPVDGDYKGALILRQAGGPIAAAPTSGIVYLAGDPLGTASTLTATVQNAWDDLGVDASVYDYAVFAFDESTNYATTAARAPRLESESFRWCTDETAAFTATSSDAHATALWLTTDAGAAFSDVPLVPAPSDAVNATPLVTVGAAHAWRAVLVGPSGTAVGPPHTFFASPQLLPIVTQPIGVGPGGAAKLAVDPLAWPTLVAEVDANPVPGVEQWSAATVSASGQMSVPIATPGEYKMRVRPVLSGCPDAAWTTSNAFDVGRYFYVKNGGSGTQSGVDPKNAMATIGAAIAAATGGTGTTTVYVAAGDYAEQVTLRSGVDLYGSYDQDFTLRTLSPTPSTVLHGAPPVVTANAAAAGATVVLSGLDVQSNSTVVNDVVTLSLTGGAKVSLLDSRVEGPTTPGSYASAVGVSTSTFECRDSQIVVGVAFDLSYGLRATASTVSASRCTVTAPRPASKVYPFVLDGSDGVVDRCTFDSGAAIDFSDVVDVFNAGTLRLTNSVLHGVPTASAAGVVIGLQSSPFAVITNNTIVGPANTDLMLVESTPAVLTNNLFVAEGGLASNCVYNTTPSTPVTLRNNALAPSAVALVRASFDYGVLCPGGVIGVSGGCVTTLAGTANNVTFASTAALALTADYHLSASTPAGVQSGGRDAAMTSGCSCGDVSVDRDGATRTCSAPSTCYSIGAFERDP